MRFKNSRIIAVALSLGLVLTACNNDNTDNKTETTETSSSEADKSSEANDYDFVVVSREEGSGTRGAFTELVGLEEKNDDGSKEDKTTVEAEVQNSTNGVMTTVSSDPNAIGYISLGSLNDTVKAIKVDGVEATEANIESGDYKISRPFNLAYKEDELDDLSKDFLDYCLSTKAQDVVKEEGYVALKDTKDYEEKDGLKGSITVAGSTSVTPLIEKLAESYKSINPEVKIEVQSNGSTAGIQAVRDNAASIAMSSRELDDQESKELKSEVIATDGIAVVVNNDSKIDDLTVEELRQIFSGEIINTGELD
ncbi:substrate-binding domain-containing protein [uncultured Anaerococcus sp.]|uniref:substrate-binding domain-containing protein n=1 Tax=uncultured Anaerococcus sp. TaxID=293428 RepID=UPI00262E3660|nr:substrate-binding domain-containing protein [uncultured Anaerococcus sp.]